MSSFVLFILIFGLGLMLLSTRKELRSIRDRLDGLEERTFETAPAAGVPAVELPHAPAHAGALEIEHDADSAPAFIEDEVRPERLQASRRAGANSNASLEPRPSLFANLNFEALVGGKLPIWIGGIALVFAGFFLVRYTIEAGLFGPAARSVTATIFAAALIAISELGGRIPKIGASFTADPRVGQSLAGAGIATLYGTLYMAAEIYGLVGIATAFLLVVITTAIAFALALRHGPPTALMGLIGGFAAPWVAGMGASNLPTLLLYLAVFIAALFGLAIWRRWLWLLVLASGGGTLWTFAMLATAKTDLPLLAGFIALSGAGALLAAQRFTEHRKGWTEPARYLPMALAFVQLAILLPRMDFGVIGWLFYFALSVLTIILAWRDRLLIPLVAGALLLVVSPLNAAWTALGASGLNVAVTLAVVLLFGGAGHVRTRQNTEAATYWALIGLAAPVLCWFAAAFADTGSVPDTVWGLTAALAAIAGGFMAFDRHRRRVDAPLVQGWATAACALMAFVAFTSWFHGDWMATYAAVIALGIAAWARVTDIGYVRRLAVVPLGVAVLAGIVLSYELAETVGASLSGTQALYEFLPMISEATRTALIPSLLILAITWPHVFATGRRTRRVAFVVGGAGLAAFIWLIAKQPAAIATPGQFIRLGFAERTIFTQMLFGLGWLAITRGRERAWPSLTSAGWVLACAALFRVIWFDLLLLNPVMVPQMVGPVPLANLVTAHLAFTALWLWLLAQKAPLRFVSVLQGLSLGATIITVLASIRQAVQGALISGASVETGENYLYSAGLLVLAIVWLVIGITRPTKLLRVAGLSLLTLVTLKVFLIDAAALTGLLRILSFLGLGIALIGIGWAYGRIMGQAAVKSPDLI